MQLVCKIPDELYKKWKQSRFTLDEAYQFVDCVMNGTPLSEHGRLIDADELKKKYFKSDRVYLGDDVVQILNIAPTIIPATKEGE